ncbi:hypothetical protein I317_00745 [Kwoniella heveanensis CBS 569]|nr:hypothetical protein I317_00745 [Kwoniella heveanensis CBS 569]
MADPIELRPIGKSAAAPPLLPPRHPAASTSTSTASRTGATSTIADALPGTLGSAYRTAEEKAKAAVHLQEGGLDAISVWGLGLSAWFATLALPLLLFPRILLFFSQVAPPPSTSFSTSSTSHHRDAIKDREEHYDSLTSLESTLCLSLSLGLLAVSLISLIILVPTYETSNLNPNRNANPSRKSLLGILVGLTTVSGLTMWNSGGIGGLSGVVGGGNILVAIWGWWVIVFGGGGGSKLMKKDGSKKSSKTPERFKRL